MGPKVQFRASLLNHRRSINLRGRTPRRHLQETCQALQLWMLCHSQTCPQKDQLATSAGNAAAVAFIPRAVAKMGTIVGSVTLIMTSVGAKRSQWPHTPPGLGAPTALMQSLGLNQPMNQGLPAALLCSTHISQRLWLQVAFLMGRGHHKHLALQDMPLLDLRLLEPALWDLSLQDPKMSMLGPFTMCLGGLELLVCVIWLKLSKCTASLAMYSWTCQLMTWLRLGSMLWETRSACFVLLPSYARLRVTCPR